ncbi:MAG: OB-fold domain-containing protein [Acidobacteria bacterium]|nr:OB-fold domain-containing protein [Acidobacteriota bacterium]
MRQATVYTETIIHSAPEQFAAEAPYQIALVELEDSARQLVRISGIRAAIGDRVQEVDSQSGYPIFEVIS